MPRKSLQLNLHPTLPFRSSNLALPPSPFTPRLPLTPPATPPRPNPSHSSSITKHSKSYLPPPPTNPLNWVWQCHICHRQYRLGVTRRCLDDGHYFCAGTTIVKKRSGGAARVKRHKACGSEFDYKGWKEMGVWRRGVAALSRVEAGFDSDSSTTDEDIEMDEAEEGDEHVFAPSVVSPLFGSLDSQRQQKSQSQQNQQGVWFRTKTPKTKKPILVLDRHSDKNCWMNCDYPSECRWGKAYGVRTPATTTFSFDTSTPTLTTTSSLSSSTSSPPTDFKDILTAEQQGVAESIDGVLENPGSATTTSSTSITTATAFAEVVFSPTKTAFTDLASLVQSAQRRKSRSEIQGPSPLSTTSSSSSSSSSSSPSLSLPVSVSSSTPPSVSLSTPLASKFKEDLPTSESGNVNTTASTFSEMNLVAQEERDEGEAANKKKKSEDKRRSDEGKSAFVRALDEFEFDFRKGMERAQGLFSAFGSGSGGGATGAGGKGRNKERK